MTDAISDAARIDRLEMRLTEQDLAIEDLNRTTTEQWRLIDRLTRQVAALRERVEEAGERGGDPRAPEPPPPHY
ncbi:MAG TPA: SlyX family protein [Methylobacterium sp.]|nr:SlyX family protein [Methylobacterium sp.]